MDIVLIEETQKEYQKTLLSGKTSFKIKLYIQKLVKLCLKDDIILQKTNLKFADNNGWNVIFWAHLHKKLF